MRFSQGKIAIGNVEIEHFGNIQRKDKPGYQGIRKKTLEKLNVER